MALWCELLGHQWIYQPVTLSDAAGRAPARRCYRCRRVQRKLRVVIPESRQMVEVVTAAVNRDVWTDEYERADK